MFFQGNRVKGKQKKNSNENGRNSMEKDWKKEKRPKKKPKEKIEKKFASLLVLLLSLFSFFLIRLKKIYVALLLTDGAFPRPIILRSGEQRIGSRVVTLATSNKITNLDLNTAHGKEK